MNPWEQFFDEYAEQYDQEVFTRNTANEVEFIVAHADPPPGGAILDLGCGTGRHSVPLAERGYRLTGVDISRGMLAVAARRAAQSSVAVEWVHANARDFVRPDAFDVVICLCEGAMCLLTDDEHPFERDMAILDNIRRSLRPGGKLILNVLNAARVLRAFDDEAVRTGRFDPLTLTEVSNVTQCLPDCPAARRLRERHYTAPEIRRMTLAAGLQVEGIYGGTAGNWGLRPIEMDEYELMVIARR